MAPVPPELMPPPAAPGGLWRRTPPAIFPPLMGLLGLMLGWRRAAAALDLPAALPDLAIGAATLLALFTLVAYLGKMARRPAVALEDLKILPGRAGLSAAVLSIYLLAIGIAPFAAPGARAVFGLGLAFHVILTVAMLLTLLKGPPEQRRVTPVWHLTFSGWIVAALAALSLGNMLLATLFFWAALVFAVGIWTVSLSQFARASVPAPLRPLLAIHLAPVALLGTVAVGLGAETLSMLFGAASVVLLAVLAGAAFWLLKAGFSPFWGALTFPIAATANLWLALGGLWQLAGMAALALATAVILPIVLRLYKMWAKGELAAKTGAATA
ncbi:TDT family transporter [Rhodobacter maris]|uniref:Tellurite resistance protein n=1 Tax=Rhodobacter maris TaxID=446682 RepID=A0A285SJG0_9RHOB|nr:tellurium resistance protein [Rhodobacter maris]SOC08057.1 tellurite resistance protein [Rhodobacter maris]